MAAGALLQEQRPLTLNSPPSRNDLFPSCVEEPKLLISRATRRAEAPGWLLHCQPQNLRGRAQPLPLDGGVAGAAWLVDTQGWCLGLVLKVILSGTAPCWQLGNPKGALVVTNKAVKDTHRSKKIHSLKE